MLLVIAIAKYCAHRPQFADDKDYPDGFEVSPTRMSFAGATVFRSSKIIDKAAARGMTRLGSGEWNEKEQISGKVWEEKPFVLAGAPAKKNVQMGLGVDGGNRPTRASTAASRSTTDAPRLMKMLPSTSPFLEQSGSFAPTTPAFRSISAPPPSNLVPYLPPPIFDPRPIAPPKVNYHPMQRQAHFTPISSPLSVISRAYSYQQPLSYGPPRDSLSAPRMSIQVGQHLPAFIPRPPSTFRQPSPLDPKPFSPAPSVHSIRERSQDAYTTPSPMFRNVSTPPPMPRRDEQRPFETYSRAGPIERSLPPNNGPNKLRRGMTGGGGKKSAVVGGLRYSATMGGGGGAARVEDDRW